MGLCNSLEQTAFTVLVNTTDRRFFCWNRSLWEFSVNTLMSKPDCCWLLWLLHENKNSVCAIVFEHDEQRTAGCARACALIVLRNRGLSACLCFNINIPGRFNLTDQKRRCVYWRLSGTRLDNYSPYGGVRNYIKPHNCSVFVYIQTLMVW